MASRHRRSDLIPVRTLDATLASRLRSCRRHRADIAARRRRTCQRRITCHWMSASQHRVIGFWTAVAIVMGNMIGSGVFLLPASLAAYRGLSLVGWLLSAAGAVMLALVFAHLASHRPAAGGPFAYTREAFGEVPGFLVAWGYWLS